MSTSIICFIVKQWVTELSRNIWKLSLATRFLEFSKYMWHIEKLLLQKSHICSEIIKYFHKVLHWSLITLPAPPSSSPIYYNFLRIAFLQKTYFPIEKRKLELTMPHCFYYEMSSFNLLISAHSHHSPYYSSDGHTTHKRVSWLWWNIGSSTSTLSDTLIYFYFGFTYHTQVCLL